jgi:hypothetical protein
MNDYTYGSVDTRGLGAPNTRNRETQVTDTRLSSSTSWFPETFPSDIWVPGDGHRSASRAALIAGVESQRDLHPHSSSLPAARLIADRMPTLEQQLASLIKEQQRPTLPLTIEQQLSSIIEEQQGGSPSLQQLRSIPSDRALATQHELAFLIDQQEGRYQPFEAAKNAIDRMTIEQVLASSNEGRGSFQATSSLQNSTSTIEEQLASSIGHQQGYVYRDSLQDRMPTIEYCLASLIQSTDSASQSSCFPLNLIPKQPSRMPSLGHLHLLRQLQGESAPYVQPEIQGRATGYIFGHLDEGHHEGRLPSEAHREREFLVPEPPS